MNRELPEAVPVLIEKKLFSSKDYWIEHAAAGRSCSGAYVAGVIDKFVKSKDFSK